MSHLSIFTKKYFNRYQFFASGHSVKNMHGLYQNTGCKIFNLKLVENTPTMITYKFEKNDISEPALSLISRITQHNDPGYVTIRKVNPDDNIAIVYPIGLVPTHFMAYARDLFQQHKGFKTWIQNSNVPVEEALYDPFSFDFKKHAFDFLKDTWCPYLFTSPKTWATLKQFSNEGQFFVDHLCTDIETAFASIYTESRDDILRTFVKDYMKSYPFEVKDTKWDAYDGLEPHFIYNKAAQFAHFSKYFHALPGGMNPRFSTDGGLSMSALCPGIEFIFSSGMTKYHTSFTRWPGLIHGRSRYFSNHSMAYWKMIYLRQLIEDCGIKTDDESYYRSWI